MLKIFEEVSQVCIETFLSSYIFEMKYMFDKLGNQFFLKKNNKKQNNGTIVIAKEERARTKKGKTITAANTQKIQDLSERK